MRLSSRILVITMLCGACGFAYADNYLGLDLTNWWLQGRKVDNYSMRNVLPKNYTGAELYLAHRFNNDVGLSVGYSQYGAKSQEHYFGPGEVFLGDTQNGGDSTRVSVRNRSWNLDLVGYYLHNDRVECIGQLGLVYMRAKIDGSTTVAGMANQWAASDSFQLVPRVSLGMQYFSWQRIGFRLMVNWLGTNMYRLRMLDEDGVIHKIRPFSQSFGLNLGLVYRF